MVQAKGFRVGGMLYITAASGAYMTTIPRSLGDKKERFALLLEKS